MKIFVFIVYSLYLLPAFATHVPGKPLSQTVNQICFTENKGQVHDQNNKPRPDVLFSTESEGLVCHLKNSGISYQLSKVNSYKEIITRSNEKINVANETSICRVDISWPGSNTQATLQTDEALAGYTNYFLSTCPNGALNVKAFTGVTYKNIYQGVNLHYYQKNGHLKYDYIVAPGAAYSQIQLQVNGASGIELQKDGSVIFKTAAGVIREEAPEAYQRNKKIKSKWLLKDNVLSFVLQGYDPSVELIIDPLSRLWGTYYGGAYREVSNGITTDAAGNVYMTGDTYNSTGATIATAGSYQTTFSGGGYPNAFLAKFTSAGVRLWGTYYGGYGYPGNSGKGCTVDNSGNVYMAGTCCLDIASIIATPGSHQPVFGGGNTDAFLVKFNSAGARQWATHYGGASDEEGYSCSTDAGGNVYLCGSTISSVGTIISTWGSNQYYYTAGKEAFLVKFNSAGVRQWGTYYGDAGTDIGYCTVTDAAGNVYMAGETSSNASSFIASAGSHQPAFGGGTTGSRDAFLVKFDTYGTRQWGTYYGGTGDDLGYFCALAPAGFIYLGGKSSSTNAIATAGTQQTVNLGSDDAFLAKFNLNGVRQWGTFCGGAGQDWAYAGAVDALGNPYLTGFSTTTVSGNISTPGSYQPNYSGSGDITFLAKYNANGIRQWGTYYNGAGSGTGYACLVDQSGKLYLSGMTVGNTGTSIATPGSQQSNDGGYIDAFLVQFADCYTPTTPLNITPAANQLICSNSNTQLMATANGYINWYASPTGTLSLGTGPSFFTPVLSAGTYTYYAEASTCVDSISPGRAAITITVTNTVAPSISVNSGSVCAGQSFTMVPSGAVSYTYSSGSAVVVPPFSTTYTVTATAANGCVISPGAISTVTVSPTPVITVNSGTMCVGKSFTLNPAGAVTYTFQGGNAVVSPVSAFNTYTVTGTSSVGCVALNSAIASVTAQAMPVIGVSSASICAAQSYTIVPSGAITYTFSGGGPIVSPMVSSSYSVTGTNAAGCVNSTAAISNVTVNPLPVITVNSGSICYGQSFTISPSGANTYTISGGVAVVSPTSTTSYSVTGTDVSGCTNTVAVISNVTVNAIRI